MDFHPNQVFICMDEDDVAVTGNSLEAAYQTYKDSSDNHPIEDLSFFVAVPLEIEMKLVTKHVPVPADPPTKTAARGR